MCRSYWDWKTKRTDYSLAAKTSDSFLLFFAAYFVRNHQSSRCRGRQAWPACVIWVVQHGEAMGVKSMTERFLPPEELISQECDGRAIIATGALLTSLGQVAGCREESKHHAVATPTTYFATFFMWNPFVNGIFVGALSNKLLLK